VAHARMVALLVSFAIGGPLALTACGGSGVAAGTTTAAPKPRSKPLPPNAIKIHWKKHALVPAPRPGHVCIVTYKTGRFCASYRAGQVPATAMKRQLLENGYIPVTIP
jgi:hypothetical protein